MSSPATIDPDRQLTWRRLRGTPATVALVASMVASWGVALGTVVIGRLAEEPSGRLIWLLIACLIGGAVLDTAGRYVWAGVVDSAEGRLRGDLLTAALSQPVSVIGEQAVGEVLDRVDDDTHEVGTLTREMIWRFVRALFTVVPLYLAAALSWWPAWFLLPVTGLLCFLSIRRMLGRIAELKVREEMAWTDHAAALEEGVAGRDDLRTSLGQPYVVRRLATLSATVHRRFHRVVLVEGRMVRRTGLLLHGMLAATALIGIAMVDAGSLDVARLVTVFLATTLFVGQVDELAQQLPDLQAGLGAVIRLRQMLASPAEPRGGTTLPDTGLDVVFSDLHFGYPEDTFALSGVDLAIPAGRTCALVGRTGSGKSTLASLVSRAEEPEPGSVFVGGVDVLDCDLESLRARVGVVTQRTEILVGTMAQNITLFADLPRAVVEAAVADLGLSAWVAGMPDGLDTMLGPGGITLSSGEEQLVAFARLLVRDVQVVILDEATARMDPLTEARVVAAADRLLSRRTGIVVAHRLSTTARADQVAVLDHGSVIQQGDRARLAAQPGPFRDLLADSQGEGIAVAETVSVTGVRRQGEPPSRPETGTGPSLARGIAHALRIHPEWGTTSIVLFTVATITGSLGAVTGFFWGRLIERLQDGSVDLPMMLALAASLLTGPFLLPWAFFLYPRWWIAVLLRTRMSVLVGQTEQRRLERTPPGEVVARALDSDRFVRYADHWVDVIIGLAVATVTAAFSGGILAGLVLLAVMAASAIASVIGRPIAGRSAAAASASRARFGRSLVSTLESARTVKLAAATDDVHAHLLRVDDGRVAAAIREHRVSAVLNGIPNTMVQAGVVVAWSLFVSGHWSLATTLLVSAAVSGFGWFGQVAGRVITDAPGCRAWQQETARFAGGVDLMELPHGVDLVRGVAPPPPRPGRVPLTELRLTGLDALHDDGTIGVHGVDLSVRRGELVLLLGQIGSGKSSLLSAVAGLVAHRGSIHWNGQRVGDPELFLRPGQVALVGQVPRVLSGSFAGNILLDHRDRTLTEAVADARLEEDIADAGGAEALVGHRGVRLSGGQVQRLALARALATDAELLLADDVSSALDARTEVQLWRALRARGATVLGSTSKRAALAQADRVVVLADGRVVDQGPWSELTPDWGHLSA